MLGSALGRLGLSGLQCSESPLTVIQPRHRRPALQLDALWQHRDLCGMLALRDLRVRYKQSILGIGWAVIQPFATMVVLHIFFGKMLGVAERITDAPYPVFLYAALIPWTLFASAVIASSSSFVSNAHILTKVFFPRLVLPVSACVVPVIDFGIAFVVLIGLMFWFGVTLSWTLVLVPLLVLGALIAALGAGIMLASLTVVYRDFRHIVPFGLQLWFFMTPVIFDRSFVSPRYQWLLDLNPIGGTIEAFRSVVLDRPIDWGSWVLSIGVGLLVLVIGLLWFSRLERRFADVV